MQGLSSHALILRQESFKYLGSNVVGVLGQLCEGFHM